MVKAIENISSVENLFQMQFFGTHEFCHYNMFNHHFFDNKKSRDVSIFIFLCVGCKILLVKPSAQLDKIIEKKHGLKSSCVNLNYNSRGQYLEKVLKMIPEVPDTSHEFLSSQKTEN